MSQTKKKTVLLGCCFLSMLLMAGLCALRGILDDSDKEVNKSTYFALPADTSTEDPLLYLDEEFHVLEGFHSNMPIVIVTVDEEFADYKDFKNSSETVDETIDPYIDGKIRIIDGGNFDNSISDEPVLESSIRIKKRGHTSYNFDKEQFLMKFVKEDGTDNDLDVLGMGENHSWILNGSMADKSMIRNYLAYRLASEIDGMTPDSQFCEVIFEKNGELIYQGLCLMMESIGRDKNRIDIDEYKQKNAYTSYIVRRDRYTAFDPMLDTYRRLNGLSEEWIGVKYPTAGKLTEKAKKYIEEDFSRIERVLYSEDESVFKNYDRYIDVDSFADYFLFNEFLGNYDAGLHSTYMYKNSGERLKIGPVWDFDQAMNNYSMEEMDPEKLAFQERAFFDRLTLDIRFVRKLEKRYAKLRNGTLNEDHINAVIDETVAYIDSARQREWYRWAADYEDGSGENWHNYTLLSYEKNGMLVERFNDNYDQEIYNIKVYLHKHGKFIGTELRVLERTTCFDSSLGNRRELFLCLVMILFFVPAVMLLRKG